MPSFPKPQARIVDRIRDKREAEAQARAFKAAVWKRDGSKCRACRRRLIKSLSLIPERGEVHHIHGRNVRPEDRYNVKQAVLLCARCHADPQVIARFRRQTHET